MNADELTELVRVAALRVASDRGLDASALPTTVRLRRGSATDGDYTTTLALQAARPLGVEAQALADWLAEALARCPGIRSATAAGPGFVNLVVEPPTGRDLLHDIVAGGAEYGVTGVELDLAPHTDNVGVLAPSGAPVEAAELSELIGREAARYLKLRARPRSSVRLDVERWRRRTEDNPLFRVQYAHARLSALARGAVALDVTLPPRRPVEPPRSHPADAGPARCAATETKAADAEPAPATPAAGGREDTELTRSWASSPRPWPMPYPRAPTGWRGTWKTWPTLSGSPSTSGACYPAETSRRPRITAPACCSVWRASRY